MAKQQEMRSSKTASADLVGLLSEDEQEELKESIPELERHLGKKLTLNEAIALVYDEDQLKQMADPATALA